MSSLCLQCLYAGGRAYINAHFGVGSGSIFLDDVQCTSSSNQLLRCPARKILSHNCHHSDDAGVGCEGMFHKKFYISCARNFCLPCLYIQPLVHLVSCDWQEVIYKMKAEWRSVWTMNGVLCVMAPGEKLMLLWCVSSWDTTLKVHTKHILYKCSLVQCVYAMQQVQ